MGRVQDQVAVVTGAAHGLRTVAGIAAKGGRAFGLRGDVTDEGPAAKLIASAVPGGQP